MTTHDTFADLARFYDPIMGEIDYDRWLVVSSLVAELLDKPSFRHIDLACGTGRLLKRFEQRGWNSVGIDISPAMLREATKGPFAPPVAAADLCALPFRGRFDYATCVFDSLNFLLDADSLRAAFRSVSDALTPDGLFYFDVITERMVSEHFADQTWHEKNGPFSTLWQGAYNRSTRIADLSIRVNTGPATLVRERVHTSQEIAEALEDAGLTLLGEFDAENWKKPRYKTIRIDMIAAKKDSQELRRRFDAIRDRMPRLLK